MAPRPPPNLRQTLRFWWLDHGQTFGLILGGAAILLFATLLIPRGPVTLHTGVVTGFRALSSETGTEVYATIDVVGHPAMVRLRPHDTCLVGSPIILRKARFPLGVRYAVEGRGCAALTPVRPATERP